MLAHAAFYSIEIHPSVDIIVRLLEDIACRWAGTAFNSGEAAENLASRFGKRLRDARSSITNQGKKDNDSVTLDIRQPVYSEQPDQVDGETRPTSPAQVMVDRDADMFSSQQQFVSEIGIYSPDSISLAFPPLPNAFRQYGIQYQQHSPQDMVPVPNAQDHFSLNPNYEMVAQAQAVLPSHHLGNFDIGSFNDMSGDINEQVCYSDINIKSVLLKLCARQLE